MNYTTPDGRFEFVYSSAVYGPASECNLNYGTSFLYVRELPAGSYERPPSWCRNTRIAKSSYEKGLWTTLEELFNYDPWSTGEYNV